jgi:hypothetical protein
MSERTFDRLPDFDERSRSYPIRTLIGQPARKPRRWRLLERLDQGQEGACVGFGWAHELAALPVKVKQTNTTARGIYVRARQLDPWPGEDYEGTSVLAGAKAVRERGHMPEFRWAFGVDDVLDTLSAHGPVVIGVNWYRDMAETDAQGYIRPVGEVLGGHCVVLRGLIRERGRWVVIGRNSWGRGWGIGGDFKMVAEWLRVSLEDEGEACVPVVRR